MICVINHKKVQNLVHKLAHCRMSTILSLYYGRDEQRRDNGTLHPSVEGSTKGKPQEGAAPKGFSRG